MKQKAKRKAKQTLDRARRHKRAMIIVGCGMVVTATITYGLLRTTLPIAFSYTKADVKVDQSLTLTLNQYVQPIAASKVKITPAVEGTWQFVQRGIVQNGTLVFTPKTYFKEHTTYTVTVPSTKRVFGNALPLPSVSFTTEKAPSLANAGMASWKDGQTIAADAAITASLTSPNHHLRNLELRTTPTLATTMTAANDKDYTWKPTGMLPQGTDVTFEVFDTKNQQSLVKKTVRIAAEPALTSPIHRDNVDERDAITLMLGQTIDSSTAHISFDTAGNGTWQNDMTYVFTPTKLAPNTAYHYTVSKGLRSRDGGILQNDITGDFVTVGPIAVVAMSPYGNGLSQASQTLSFSFSRPVDHASAEQRFSISTGQITGKSWKGNTLYVSVANLGYQQTVSASIGAGVKNTTFGVPSARSFGLSFTTEVRTARLNVPQYGQQHAATCTAASLRMVLAYRGVGSDEMGLVNAMGYAPRDADKSTTPPTWDDPQVMFVGSVDGSIAAGTGAGPDAPPVAKAARAYGRNASSVTGINANWIAQQLYDGNPVIMFGAYRNTGYTTWQTPSGATRIMNLTGHASVVVGVKGEPSNPLGFWINDPLRGTYYWTTSQVNGNISLDPDRQAVVVY